MSRATSRIPRHHSHDSARLRRKPKARHADRMIDRLEAEPRLRETCARRWAAVTKQSVAWWLQWNGCWAVIAQKAKKHTVYLVYKCKIKKDDDPR